MTSAHDQPLTPITDSPNSKHYPSPPLSRDSQDSDESLRALELSDGPALASRSLRPRTYSFSGYAFGEPDLIPLAASDGAIEENRSVPGEKSIGLSNGTQYFLLLYGELELKVLQTKGVALIVGLQVKKLFWKYEKRVLTEDDHRLDPASCECRRFLKYFDCNANEALHRG
jgi:hypothetical protein